MNERKIHYGAWLNHAYGDLFEHHFRSQAAIKIQSFFRSKTLPTPMPILEPTDQHYLRHAEKIKQGEYISLDFSDSNFVRNVFKALRLNSINKNEALTAVQLFRAKEWLDGYSHTSPQLITYDYDDENGPYTLSEIDYSTEKERTLFLENITGHDRKYIAINFPKSHELYFLFDILSQKDALTSDKINPTIIKFISIFSTQLNLTPEEKKHFTFDNLKKLTEFKLKIIFNIFLKKIQEKKLIYKISLVDKNSLRFLTAILELDEKIPSIAISKQHNPDDIYSPILCFILPTHKALQKLQCIMHGNEAVPAKDTIGIIDTHFIRQVDEQHHARPVEQVYPGIQYLQRPHGYLSRPFLLTFHDNMHCWRAGTNFKRMARYCREILTKKGICQSHDFFMSKAIWSLVDLDYEDGAKIRLGLQYNPHSLEPIKDFFLSILQNTNILSFYKDKKDIIITDLFLLFLIDMRRNSAIWNDMISDLTQGRITSLMQFLFLMKKKSERIEHILKTIECYSPIMNSHANRSDEYIILCAKLKNSYTQGAKLFLNAVDKIGIDKVFHWGLNSGLIFHSNYEPILNDLNIKSFKLDDLEEDMLEKILCLICKKHLQEQEFEQLLSRSSESYLQRFSDLHLYPQSQHTFSCR